MSTDSSKIKITGEPTLDPQVCKFIVDYPLSPNGTVTCRDKKMAEGSPLLEALFQIDGITQIMITDNNITLAKSSMESWQVLGRQIGTVIREQIGTGKKLLDPDAAKKQPSEEMIRQRIEELFTNDINPAIASHGGRVELADVDGTKVYVRLGGGCQGCASANATLKQGIAKAIKAILPEVTEVLDATDHSSGTNPYYR